MPYKNKEDQNKASKRYYYRNREAMIRRTNKRSSDIRKWWKKYKSTLQCTECGENHPACIEFHHKDSADKDMDLSTGVTKRHWGRKRIMKEIEKCDILCSNCHAKVHWID